MRVWIVSQIVEALLVSGLLVIFSVSLLLSSVGQSWALVWRGIWRRRRLKRRLVAPDRVGSISLGRGTIILDRQARRVALGWGSDASHDVVYDRVSYARFCPESPLMIRLRVEPNPEPLELVFERAEEASAWQRELTAIADQA